MSPVTKGLLARSRKASGSLIPPSFNLSKVKVNFHFFIIPNRKNRLCPQKLLNFRHLNKLLQIQDLRKPESGLSSVGCWSNWGFLWLEPNKLLVSVFFFLKWKLWNKIFRLFFCSLKTCIKYLNYRYFDNSSELKFFFFMSSVFLL